MKELIPAWDTVLHLCRRKPFWIMAEQLHKPGECGAYGTAQDVNVQRRGKRRNHAGWNASSTGKGPEFALLHETCHGFSPRPTVRVRVTQ
jgi:hypothetical protein